MKIITKKRICAYLIDIFILFVFIGIGYLYLLELEQCLRM